MQIITIIILSLFLALSLFKWLKWRLTSLVTIMFCEDKFREPTHEEIQHYSNIVVKKMLHIK